MGSVAQDAWIVSYLARLPKSLRETPRAKKLRRQIAGEDSRKVVEVLFGQVGEKDVDDDVRRRAQALQEAVDAEKRRHRNRGPSRRRKLQQMRQSGRA